MTKFQLFQNTERKHFSWGLFLLKSEILGCRSTTLEKKNSFANTFKEFLKFWNILFFLTSSRIVSAVGCRIYSINCIKKDLYYILFSEYFPKFSVQLFQNTLINLSVVEFSIVLDCRL